MFRSVGYGANKEVYYFPSKRGCQTSLAKNLFTIFFKELSNQGGAQRNSKNCKTESANTDHQ